MRHSGTVLYAFLGLMLATHAFAQTAPIVFGQKFLLTHQEINAFEQTRDTIADLRAGPGDATVTQTVSLRGLNAVGDGGGGEFYWAAASTASDNGYNVILPTGQSGPGRWVRLVIAGSSLPAPAPSTLGGVFSSTAPTNDFANGVDTSGNVLYGRPACGNLSNASPSCATDATNASNIGSGTLAAARGGAGTITGALKGNGAGVVSQAGCSDLTNGAPSCGTDTTNASNITSGTLPAARLPAPSATTLGGIESIAPVSHQYVSYVDTLGVPHLGPVSWSDVAGLGTSATVNTGTSGGSVPLNNGGFTQSGVATFSNSLSATGIVTGSLFPRVATKAALALLPTATYPNGVQRDDFATGNGAPPILYFPETGTCAANSRINDGGSCIDDTSGDTNSWYTNMPSSGWDPREFGAVAAGGAGNADIFTAANAIRDASPNGYALQWPPGVWNTTAHLQYALTGNNTNPKVRGVNGFNNGTTGINAGTIIKCTLTSGACIDQTITASGQNFVPGASMDDFTLDITGSSAGVIGYRFGGTLGTHSGPNFHIVNLGGAATINEQMIDNVSGTVTEEYNLNGSLEVESTTAAAALLLDIKQVSGSASFDHGTINLNLQSNLTTAVKIEGGAQAADVNWTFQGNIGSTTIGVSVDATSALTGIFNWLPEAAGGTGHRFSVASGGLVNVFGEVGPPTNTVWTDTGTVVLRPGNAGAVTGAVKADGAYHFTQAGSPDLSDSSNGDCSGGLGLTIGGSSVGITHGTIQCKWVIRGPESCIKAYIPLTSKGGLTGNVAITGFPVPPASDNTWIPMFTSNGITSATSTGLTLQIYAGSAALPEIVSTNNAVIQMTGAMLNNNTDLAFDGCYL